MGKEASGQEKYDARQENKNREEQEVAKKEGETAGSILKANKKVDKDVSPTGR